MGGDFVGWLCMMFPMIRDYLLTNSGVLGVMGVFIYLFLFLFYFLIFCICRSSSKGKGLEDPGMRDHLSESSYTYFVYIYIITIDLLLNS